MSAKQENTALSDRDVSAYTLAEAARYTRLPPATLRSWMLGREYPTTEGVAQFPPLIRPASLRPPLLSFSNLIEAHVLRSLRTEHGVSVKALRNALTYAEKALRIQRLLLRSELCTDAGRIFLDRYGELIELSASGQLAMRRLFEEHLKRVEWDFAKLPVRFYPFILGSTPNIDRSIVIDPRIAFGRPIVKRRGVSTSAIADRIDARESIADIASDYDLTSSEVEQAALYERAA